MTMCGKFGGDCFKFVTYYKKYKWINQLSETLGGKVFDEIFESHVCTPQEITQAHYDTGRLYICPPADKLYFLNNYESYPHQTVISRIIPNYDIITDKKEVQNELNNFFIVREEISPFIDLTILDSSPIVKKP